MSWHEALQFSLREYINELDHLIHPKRIYHGSYGENYGINVWIATDDPSIYLELPAYPQYGTKTAFF